MPRLGPIALALTFSLAACNRGRAPFPLPGKGKELGHQVTLPLPTKDDVALINGHPLSLTAFANLRTALRARSTEEAFWGATACFALLEDASMKEKPLAPGDAAMIVRYAMGTAAPDEARAALLHWQGSFSAAAEVKNDLNQLLAHASIRKNAQALAEIR